MVFSRTVFLKELERQQTWDVIIIGGGATGLGIAVDAASRGYRTLLLEQSDFAKGTSSRSTKLVHGGVRYLAQGDIALVYEALHERDMLLKNAPHLVHEQQFIIPCFHWFTKLFYLIGLTCYDLLAGRSSFAKSASLNSSQVLKAIPGLSKEKLVGGVSYSDGQFNDARLAINLAQTAAEQGGVLLNYVKVCGLVKNARGKLNGVVAKDLETGQSYHLKTSVVINATGVFADDILKMDVPGAKPLLRPSQGAHIVVDNSFLQGNVALMIPKTSDGRVLFAVPWHDKVLLGTTDTPVEQHNMEPKPLAAEIDFILKTAGQYLIKKPVHADILSSFAGLRPLAAPDDHHSATKEISRSHKLMVSASGLITITGGKWTTYRKMAKDTLDRAIHGKQLSPAACVTEKLRIHGSLGPAEIGEWAFYGSDAAKIRSLIQSSTDLRLPVYPGLPLLRGEVIWMMRQEMARTVEDVLARRSRLLFVDAEAARKLAPAVAQLIAEELHRDADWVTAQLLSFNLLVQQYLFKFEKQEVEGPVLP
ncbi:glycerol-3-phosphate dehydrogenase [Pedobacter sp. CAN_A7]|uniref:glycerol-3-phosphate dehydrogenase/oxidase n=1 Tax=Pedobacter sp. CAN_A7 TaxID=2787722 RepID=UPI0018C9C0A7